MGDVGLNSYYQSKLDGLENTVREKTQNLRRLQAQRNELNSKGNTTTMSLCFREREKRKI